MVEIGLILSFVCGMVTMALIEWAIRDYELEKKRCHYSQFKKVKVNFVRNDDENYPV